MPPAGKPAAENSGGHIRFFGLLWLAGVAMRMTLLVMPPVIPQVHGELHLSETQVGLLIGLPLAVFAIAAIPGSLLIARIGATVAVTLGMAIAAIAGGARAAAVDVWTLYAAAIVSAFGVAIMQPGMPTLVREWLPSRIALGTIGYSAGMLMGAMFPAVFTIAFVLPAVGGNWRLDVLLWAVPALLMAPVFLLLSPRIRDSRDKLVAGGGRWWPDWKNPLVWLLGFTFASNNSTYFVTSAFLGDYLVTLGKPELLGPALGWLNGSQIFAVAVLLVTVNRLQLRAWPFLVFGPIMFACVSRAARLYLIVVRHCRRNGGHWRCRGGHDDGDPGAAGAVGRAGRRAADRRRHVHRQLYLRGHHSDHLRRAVGPDRQTVDRLRAAVDFLRDAHGAGRDRGALSSGGGEDARPMNFRPGLPILLALSLVLSLAVSLAPPGTLCCLPSGAAGFFQLSLHPLAEFAIPVEAAELGASRLRGDARPPRFLCQARPERRLRHSLLCRFAPAFAIFGIFQIIAMHLLPRRLEPTTA